MVTLPSRADVETLEALLSGEVAAGDVSRDLADLADLAVAVRTGTSLEPAPASFRRSLRAELLAVAGAEDLTWYGRVRERVEEATAGWRHSVRVATASAVASSLIGTTGVAAAAQAALPGDLLYPIKGLTEDARLLFASGDVARGRLHLAFARERLEEVEDGAPRLPSETLADTLGAMDEEAAAGANQLLSAHAQGVEGTLDELTAFTTETRRRLVAVSDTLPLGAVPAAENSLEVLRRIDVQVDALLDPVCSVCGAAARPNGGNDVPAVLVPRVVLPADGPAAPDACNCISSPSQPPPRDDSHPVAPPADEPAAPPAEDDPDEPVPTTSPDPVDDGGSLTDQLGDVVEPIDDVTGLVDDLLGDTGLDDAVDDLDDSLGDVTDPLLGGDDTADDDPGDAGDGLLDGVLD